MEQNHCSKKSKQYTHLSEKERYQLEILLKKKEKISEIVRILGRSRATIYREKARGTVNQLTYDLKQVKKYRADVGQRDYEQKGKNKERGLKIGTDRRLEAHIRQKILREKYSPDAIVGEIRKKGLVFETSICTKTLYNYISQGIFSGIGKEKLWERGKKRKRRYGKLRRRREAYIAPRRITERPEEANNREEYGHWEGDCVCGPQGSKASLLTLTERKSLEEIIIKLENATQENVKREFDRLERKYGKGFRLKFKSITFDNGPEFLNWKCLELSCLRNGVRRTVIYYAHPYSSWERGTNENQNRMIRRFIPKGTRIERVSKQKINEIQKWMNKYPRKRLGYKSANDIVQDHLQSKEVDDLRNFSTFVSL
jgi:transposase, IS30 family